MKTFQHFVLRENYKIEKAKERAIEKHKLQWRKFSNEPYHAHPLRVAKTVMKYTRNADIIAAAYLHDTVEDTKTTYEELDAEFRPKVSNIVKELTSIPADLEKVGKTAYLIKKMNSMSPEALLIKLADRLDNLGDLSVAKKSWADKYIGQSQQVLGNLTFSKLKSEHNKIIRDIILLIQDYKKRN